MKGLPTLSFSLPSWAKRKKKEPDLSLKGSVRVDPDPIHLARRLHHGDVAVIDVMDLDQRAAEALAAAKPVAVLNAQDSISGRYPNGGPLVLARAGIPLVDGLGRDILSLRDGTKVRILGGDVSRGDAKVASGKRQDLESIATAMEGAHEGLKVQLETFAANAMDVVSHESGLLLEGANLPDVTTKMQDRAVVILTTGFEHMEQIKAIRGFLSDRRPAIIAVGEGADVAMGHAYAPDIIVGKVEGVSDEALLSGAEVILHDPSGLDAGESRLDALNIKHSTSHVAVESEDLAILLARANGANVIVTVGVRASLLDFLEKGRTDAAGTFLARLVAGGDLIDAGTLAKVYRHQYSPWTLVALVLSALFVLGNALALTPGGAEWLRSLWPTVASWFGGTS